MSISQSNSEAKAKSLELLVDYQSETYPTKGGLLLFGKDREKLFADPIARMIRFEGITKNSAIDELENRSIKGYCRGVI